MPITCALYCPNNGPDLGDLAADFVEKFVNCDRTIHWAGARDLGNLGVDVRLYLLAHAHYEFSKFQVDDDLYTAEEMAEMLVQDGLPAGFKHMELLTCSAGLSTVTRVLMEKYRNLSDKVRRARAANDNKKVASLQAEFNKLSAQLPKASEYESDDQVLPLAAQLAQALGRLKRTRLIIACYKAPVSYYIPEAPGEVYLVLPPPDGRFGPRKAAEFPKLKTEWRCG